MHKFIPLSVPNLSGNEIKYVTEALESEWVSTGGSMINQFENMIAEFVGVKQAVACQSGTAGLHLALLEVGVEADEEVIVPTLTFIAAVNPIKYIGAEPVFMDCDDSLCIDPVKLDTFLQNECEFKDNIVRNKKSGKRIRAIVVVHVFGNIANMEYIMNLAAKYHLEVIEDATEALGSTIKSGKYANRYAGTIGSIGVYSFNGNKIMTTGGGGMIVSNNLNALEHMKYLSTQAKDDTMRFIHHEIGYNYRMTNIQAALGVAQMEQLPSFIQTKKENYNLYKKELQNIPGIHILNFSENVNSNCWFYSLYVDRDDITRDDIITALEKENIQTRPIWGLIHEQLPYHTNEAYQIHEAVAYWQCVVNLPCSTNLSKEDVLFVTKVIKDFCVR